MTPIGFIVVIGTPAIGFMLYVLVAFCKDRPSEKCHVVHVLRAAGDSEEWDNSSARVAEIPEMTLGPAKGTGHKTITFS